MNEITVRDSRNFGSSNAIIVEVHSDKARLAATK